MTYPNVLNRFTIGNAFLCSNIRANTSNLEHSCKYFEPKLVLTYNWGWSFYNCLCGTCQELCWRFNTFGSCMHLDVELWTGVIKKPLLPVASCSELISILLFVLIFFVCLRFARVAYIWVHAQIWSEILSAALQLHEMNFQAFTPHTHILSVDTSSLAASVSLSR